MDHISAPYFFEAASTLDALLRLPETDTRFEDVARPLVRAHQQMIELHGPNSLYASALRTAFQSGEFLAQAIKAETDDPSPDRIVTAASLSTIKRRYDQYRSALLAALSIMGTFLVSQKGSHDVLTLLFQGEKLFPAEIREKAPEAIFDAQQTGKCLAYGAATACGFHTFRVTESVLRRYWSLATGGSAHPKVRSLGVYIASLTRAGAGDPKVLAALKQLNELHRNPLIHPEAALDIEEALNIVGLARSAVAAMLLHLPKAPLTTTTAAP